MRALVFIVLGIGLWACPELNFAPQARPKPDAGTAFATPALETRKTPECWRKDERRSGDPVNSCRYCHTTPFPGSGRDDSERQGKYPSEENPFANVTAGQREHDEQLVPTRAELESIIALENFLRTARQRGGGPGNVVGQVGRPELGGGIDDLRYFPDLDYGDARFALVDRDGFVGEAAAGQTVGAAPVRFLALDTDHCSQRGIDPCDLHPLSASGWRAVAWLPFSHATTWPRLGGALHVVFVRLPEVFRRSAGKISRAAYIENLDRLERAVRGDPLVPAAYAADASSRRLIPFRYPIGFEAVMLRFYVAPSTCASPSWSCRATRVREVQYLSKTYPSDEMEASLVGGSRLDSRARREGAAAAELGLSENGSGWDYAAFIEASDGPDSVLRPQAPPELLQCSGCHSPRIGASVDSLFVLPRKVPGPAGWRPMDYRVADRQNLTTGRMELADALRTFLGERAATLPDGTFDPVALFGHADGIVEAGKRARQIVRAQDFSLGRDPVLAEADYHESVPAGADGKAAPPPHPAEPYAPVFGAGP
jgi:hypothetical protein